MKRCLSFSRGRSFRGCAAFALVALLALTAAACGGGNGPHTSDPKLKGIDVLLAAQLPTGSTMARVTYFLSSRGYALERAPNSQTIVATVHHINPETVQPEAAKVTFHFDANDKLLSYDLEPANPLPTP